MNTLVLASEIAGVSLALQFATGIDIRWWALPVALSVWFMLWRARFGTIEHGVSILALVTLCFVAAALRLHPDWREVAAGFVPRIPSREPASYAFMAVGIIGATVSPYLISFYSSGAIEEKWKPKDLPINRVVAFLGMGFGCVVSMAVLVVAAQVLAPRGILVDLYHQTAAC